MDVTRETGIATVRTEGNHTLVAGNCFTIHGLNNPLFDDRTFVVDDVEPNLPLRGIQFNVGIITSGIYFI